LLRRNIIMSDPDGKRFPWSSPQGPAPAVNPFAGAASAGTRGGRVTLADLQKALAAKSPEEQARARQQEEQQRSMAEMEGRIMSGAQHVLVYHDPAVQAQALAKIPVEDIKKKAAEAPGELGPRDAVARQLLRSPCVHVKVDVFVRTCVLASHVGAVTASHARHR
jgi:hypothetical protein